MSRDVLIILLVLGLLANILLVAGVAWVNHRAARRAATLPAADPGAAVAADETDPARLAALAGAPADPDRQALPETGPAAIAASSPTQSAVASPARRPVARRTSRSGAATAGGDGASAGRRNRRFVLPDDDGSHARTDRAIAAFLGEPVAPDPEAVRSGRRRHRARRPAGAPIPRTDLVLSLAGSTPDPRVVHALSAAMRSTVRSSDEVVELPGGRLRITLEADVGGGEAFVRRARNVVKPWLTALDPDLQLRVERPRNRQRATASS